MLSIDLPATSRISGTDYPLPALVNAEHRPYQKKTGLHFSHSSASRHSKGPDSRLRLGQCEALTVRGFARWWPALPVELQCQLNFASRVSSGTDDTKAPTVERSVWPAESWMVESVKELRSKLQPRPLSEFAHRERFQ